MEYQYKLTMAKRKIMLIDDTDSSNEKKNHN